MPDAPEPKEPIKVTDRRSFRPDGTRREADVKAEPASAPEASPAVAATGAKQAATAPPIRGEGFTIEPGAAKGKAEGSDDAMFVNLIVSIYQSGCIHLGLAEDPELQGAPVDFEAARASVEMLRSLRQKTAGNLTSEESRILESLLSELQMSFAMKAADT